WDASRSFTFTDEELERLAIDEHNRWWHERRDGGWKLIPWPDVEDPEEVTDLLEEAKRRKESPYLISWEDLLKLDAEVEERYGGEIKGVADLDRIAVQEIPNRLAAVGREGVRA